MAVSRVVKLSKSARLGLWACHLKHFQKGVTQMLNKISVDMSHSHNYFRGIAYMVMLYAM